MEGKHLIEAVADQKLLEVVLDAVNALEDAPSSTATAELAGGKSVEVSASRDAAGTVVGLKEL